MAAHRARRKRAAAAQVPLPLAESKPACNVTKKCQAEFTSVRHARDYLVEFRDQWKAEIDTWPESHLRTEAGQQGVRQYHHLRMAVSNLERFLRLCECRHFNQ